MFLKSRQAPPSTPNLLPSTQRVVGATNTAARPEVGRLKVLLLDDQEDLREVISDYLISRCYKVTNAANGAEGLRAILQDTFDLIVCDMMMPKVGGEMFYWAVTRVRPAAGLRFVFITGHQKDPTVDHFLRRIHATVLTKPFKLEDLNRCLLDVDRKLR